VMFGLVVGNDSVSQGSHTDGRNDNTGSFPKELRCLLVDFVHHSGIALHDPLSYNQTNQTSAENKEIPYAILPVYVA